MEENTMKNIKKVIVSAIAGLMAAAAVATTAGAAEYIGNDGSYWYDGNNDNKVYVENDYGYYLDLDDVLSYCYNYCDYDYNYYNNCYYNSRYTENYVGNDACFGDVYYRADCGYYAYYGSNVRYLGFDFKFTEYIGKDRYGKKIYYRSEYGYICYSGQGNTWYTLGYNYNNIAW